jgi:hypothetical protein
MYFEMKRKKLQFQFVKCMKNGMNFEKGCCYPIIDDNNGLSILNTKGQIVLCHNFGRYHNKKMISEILVVTDIYGNDIEPTYDNVYFKYK